MWTKVTDCEAVWIIAGLSELSGNQWHCSSEMEEGCVSFLFSQTCMTLSVIESSVILNE